MRRSFALILFFLCHTLSSQARTLSRPEKTQKHFNLNNGTILLDHGTKLTGDFRVQNVGDFFTLTPQKFKGKSMMIKRQNPGAENFSVTFKEWKKESKEESKDGQKEESGSLRYSLKVINDFGSGLSFVYTRDKRIITQDLYQNTEAQGTILYLAHPEYKKYVGEIKNFMFDGVGTLEFLNGQTLSGRFTQGELNGLYLERANKTILQFVKNKLVSTIPMQKAPCQDPSLGKFHLHQGSCQIGEIQTHAANFDNNFLIYNGFFKKGKLWSGEVISMSPFPQGIFGKFQDGVPSGMVRIQNKDGQTMGTFKDGKLEGLITSSDYKSGERFIGQYEKGKKNGPFRRLNYNNEIVQRGQYRNDVLHGEIFSYDDKARLKSKDNYQSGKKLGKTTFFR